MVGKQGSNGCARWWGGCGEMEIDDDGEGAGVARPEPRADEPGDEPPPPRPREVRPSAIRPGAESVRLHNI